MGMKITRMFLSNFRGIENLGVDFSEDITKIVGDNGTGKSTIYDAYCWLLFGHPASGEKNWLPKNYNLKETDAVARLECVVDGKEISLKKVFKEVWKNKRNSVEKTLTGHTTEFYINDVPISETEYKEHVEREIIGEDAEAASVLGYLTEKMSMRDRRDMLMNFVPATDLYDIINQLNEADELKEALLKGRNIDGILAMAKDELKKINAEIKANIIVYEREKEAGAKFDIFEYQALLKEKEEITEKLNAYSTAAEAISNKRHELNSIEWNIKDLQRKNELNKSVCESALDRIHELQNKNVPLNCEVCGARLSDEKVAQLEEELNTAIESATNTHNYNNRLINETDAEIAELESKRDALEKEIEALTAEHQKLNEIGEEMDRINAGISEAEKLKYHCELAQQTKVAVDKLAEQAEYYERLEYLAKEFIKVKAETVQESINTMFENVKFRMFDVQLNGGIKEECEPLVKVGNEWLPYKSVNTGAKINANLEITHVLQKANGVYLPVFIDNAESITKPNIYDDMQTVILQVQEGSPLQIAS